MKLNLKSGKYTLFQLLRDVNEYYINLIACFQENVSQHVKK